MCGRVAAPDNYEVTLREIRLRVKLEILEDPATRRAWRPSFNLGPGRGLLCLPCGDGGLALGALSWGLLDGAKAINARAETVRELPLFRGVFASGRCVAVARGFYEWSGARRQRQPHYFTRGDGELLLLAALRREGRCTVITVPASGEVAPVHDRMPAILAATDVGQWLRGDADQAEALLRPAPAGTLGQRVVSARVNDPRNDGPECLDPPVQGSLF